MNQEEKQTPTWKIFLQSIATSVGMGSFWLLFGWLWSIGIHWAVLIPMQYLLGAMLGLANENIVGSTIARTIILLFFNGFILTLVNHKGSAKEKFSVAAAHYKDTLLNLIPYFSNFKEFSLRDRLVLYTNLIGIGIGLICYPFLTGDGSAINSFVLVILFVELANESVEKRGIIIALLNMLSSFFGFKRISRKPVDGVVNGAALGSLLGVICAFVVEKSWILYLVGTTFTLLGLICYAKHRKQLLKELEQCENV